MKPNRYKWNLARLRELALAVKNADEAVTKAQSLYVRGFNDGVQHSQEVIGENMTTKEDEEKMAELLNILEKDKI